MRLLHLSLNINGAYGRSGLLLTFYFANSSIVLSSTLLSKY